MRFYTECYLERNGRVLMLHRTKKANDLLSGYWVGVGGHVEEGESPEDGVIREVKEESGYDLTAPQLCGLITFVYGQPATETRQVAMYRGAEFTGEMIECNEGDLEWIEKERVLDLNLYSGDKIFLQQVLFDRRFFTAKFVLRDGALIDYTMRVY